MQNKLRWRNLSYMYMTWFPKWTLCWTINIYIGFEMLIHRFTIFLCLYSYAVHIIIRIRVSSMISFKQLQVKNHITNILRDVDLSVWLVTHRDIHLLQHITYRIFAANRADARSCSSQGIGHTRGRRAVCTEILLIIIIHVLQLQNIHSCRTGHDFQKKIGICCED